MVIENIASSAASASINSLEIVPSPQNTQADFAQWLNNQIESLNAQNISASQSVEKVLSGDIQNLHQVIMNIEKTKLSFEFAVQVRDRLLEGYQEVMRMQV